jgi:hypothetical protein
MMRAETPRRCPIRDTTPEDLIAAVDDLDLDDSPISPTICPMP